MSSISGSIGAYYSVKNMNAFITAQASLQKISQDAMAQQMNELLKALPDHNSSPIGRTIDVRA